MENSLKYEADVEPGLEEKAGGARRPAELIGVLGGSSRTARPTCVRTPKEHLFKNNESFK